MNNIFTSLKESFVNAAMRHSKSRLRLQLLGMSDRQLLDFGFSRESLYEGISAWPWRLDGVADAVAAGTSLQTEGLTVAPEVTQIAPAKISRKSIRKAVNELNSYSDRELAELGVNRQSIKEVVRYGRPAIEGVFQNHKSAA
ncbi:MAG: hypothetical protein ACI9XK_002746 [Granulosicoccus sp.]|jgi:uncharacterized protein YjiS (DUF1127 family)